tara:strand:+ start:221 stop:484 length:264 start_codon:yes stop_codon:yes gene_type:complete
MAYKQKKWSAFTQKDDKKKTYPKHYTEEDIKFLEEQNEDIVREEDKIGIEVKVKAKKPTLKELNKNPNVKQQVYIGKKRIGSFKPKK